MARCWQPCGVSYVNWGRLLAATFVSALHDAVHRRLFTGSRLDPLRGHLAAQAAGLHARTSA